MENRRQKAGDGAGLRQAKLDDVDADDESLDGGNFAADGRFKPNELILDSGYQEGPAVKHKKDHALKRQIVMKRLQTNVVESK